MRPPSSSSRPARPRAHVRACAHACAHACAQACARPRARARACDLLFSGVRCCPGDSRDLKNSQIELN